MALFAVCSQCGKKKLFLAIDKSGICASCMEANRVEEERIAEEKRQEELLIASDLYKKASAIWHNTVERWYQTDCDTVKRAEEAIAECDEFDSLVEQFPTTPRFPEVFEQNCYSLSENGCHSKDFGIMRVDKVDNQTVKIDFNQLLSSSKRKKERLTEVIASSVEYQRQLTALHCVEVQPDFSAEPSAPDEKSIFTLNTTNVTVKTPISRLSAFYAIDIETTGLNPVRDEILQIAAIKFLNFEPVEAFTTYVKPRNGIPLRTQEINGITPEMVQNAPYIENVIRQLDRFLTESVTGKNPPIVGHNLSFDYRFLAANDSRAFLRDRKFYDTLELSRRQYPEEDVYKLDFLTKSQLRVLRDDAHTALSDALATGMLFRKICQERIGF